MDTTFSTQAVNAANLIMQMARTKEDRAALAVSVDHHMTGCALYLGLALGPREAAMRLYELADWMAGQKEAAE